MGEAKKRGTFDERKEAAELENARVARVMNECAQNRRARKRTSAKLLTVMAIAAALRPEPTT